MTSISDECCAMPAVYRGSDSRHAGNERSKRRCRVMFQADKTGVSAFKESSVHVTRSDRCWPLEWSVEDEMKSRLPRRRVACANSQQSRMS